MKRPRFVISVMALSAALLLFGCEAGDGSGPITVFAAASLRDALTEVGTRFTATTGTPVAFNFAGSNVLAEQILATSQADVFVSANVECMDRVARGGKVLASARRDVLANQLVVIGPAEGARTLSRPEELASLPFEHLALGNPDAVPAGRYAKEWLSGLASEGGSVWSQVASRVLPAPDVRAALGYVEAHAGVLGIVYRTDAASSPRVKVLWSVPVDDGPKVRYVAAVMVRPGDEARRRAFFDFLRSADARAIFERHGFLPIL